MSISHTLTKLISNIGMIVPSLLILLSHPALAKEFESSSDQEPSAVPVETYTADFSEAAFNQPMRFFQASSGNAIEALWIAAVGRIEEDTPEKFRSYIRSEGLEGGKVVFHSPGGDLIAGLELGEIIRSQSLSTFVGRTICDPEYESEGAFCLINTMVAGRCESSCSYAFIGGSRRELFIPWPAFEQKMKGSKLGFHQYYADQRIAGTLSTSAVAELQKLTISQSQLTAGLIATYLSKMGIDGRLLELAANTPSGEMLYPDAKQLTELRVLTDSSFSAWRMRPVGDGLIAYSLDNDPLTTVTSVMAFCSAADQSAKLLISSAYGDSGLEAAVQLEEIAVATSEFESSEYGAKISVDGAARLGGGLEIDSTNVAHNVSHKWEDHGFTFRHYAVRLDKESVAYLLSGGNFGVTILSPRADGNHYAGGELSEADKRSIRLAFKNCV